MRYTNNPPGTKSRPGQRDGTFYEWIGGTCLLSRRVSTSLDHLWRSYANYCSSHEALALWTDFERLLRKEFEIVAGMAIGLSLKTDWQGYKASPLVQ